MNQEMAKASRSIKEGETIPTVEQVEIISTDLGENVANFYILKTF